MHNVYPDWKIGFVLNAPECMTYIFFEFFVVPLIFILVDVLIVNIIGNGAGFIVGDHELVILVVCNILQTISRIHLDISMKYTRCT